MDPDLQAALDELKTNMSGAIDSVQKAHKEFMATNDANLKKRDAVYDQKLNAISDELDKFERLNAAVTKIMEDAKAAAERVKEEAEAKTKLQEQLDRIETKVNRPGGLSDPDALKVKEKRSAFIDFCRVGVDRMTPERKNVLFVSDDTGGGYLAPSDYLLEIIKAVQEFSPLRSFARVITTSQKSVAWPKRTGVSAAAWAGETDPERAENTGLAYGLEDTPVHELVCDVRFSMSNLEDSAFDLEAEAKMEFAEQFGVAEGAGFVSGSGNKKPEGFLTAAGTVAINSLAAADVTADGILDLKHAIKTAYAKNAAFVLNRKTLRNVRKLKDATGNYLWMPGLAQGKPNSIDGDPYAELPDMADPAASAKCMAYGDWRRAYLIVDRLVMSVIRDGLTLASKSQVKFLARKRVGGQVILAEAIAVMTCSASSNP